MNIKNFLSSNMLSFLKDYKKNFTSTIIIVTVCIILGKLL